MRSYAWRKFMISVPGNVTNQAFYYMPMVLGFVVGYAIIALVLLPLYYRMNLTSIYTYLESRFGFYTYKAGASFFVLSRVLGAAVRIYLVVFVLHGFLPHGLPETGVGYAFRSVAGKSPTDCRKHHCYGKNVPRLSVCMGRGFHQGCRLQRFYQNQFLPQWCCVTQRCFTTSNHG